MLTIDEMLRVMFNAGARVNIFIWPAGYGVTTINCYVEFTSAEGDKMEIKTKTKDAGNIHEMVLEAYTRFRRVTNALPEFDMNRTLTHAPAPVDDEIQF